MREKEREREREGEDERERGRERNLRNSIFTQIKGKHLSEFIRGDRLIFIPHFFSLVSIFGRFITPGFRN